MSDFADSQVLGNSRRRVRTKISDTPNSRQDIFWCELDVATGGTPNLLLPGRVAFANLLWWDRGNTEYVRHGTNTFALHSLRHIALSGDRVQVCYNTESRRYEVIGCNEFVQMKIAQASYMAQDLVAGSADFVNENGDRFTDEQFDVFRSDPQVEAMLAEDDDIWVRWNSRKERIEIVRTCMDVGGLAVTDGSGIASESSGNAELQLLDGTMTGTTVTIFNSAGAVSADTRIQYKWLCGKRYVDVAKCPT